MLLAMTTFTACSDDDDKLEVPVFPESVVLNCQPGENESAEIGIYRQPALDTRFFQNYGANSL